MRGAQHEQDPRVLPRVAGSSGKPQPLTLHHRPSPGASWVVGSLGPRERSPGVGSQLCPLKPELRQSPLERGP